ncbi:transglycosylase family protein [Actinotalea sp.]|uniref:transglycosylase family protein n=1 Tax=Actinotalea sp. TaxID=1872145 RepID=UPI00356A43F2
MTFRSSLRHTLARLRPHSSTDSATPGAVHDDVVETDLTAVATPRRRTRLPLPVAALAAALVLAGGTVAVAEAHKTIELDVDGEVIAYSTFTSSVQGVLDAQEITIGSHDEVTPSVDSVLDDGDVIVVRHGRQISVVVDGTEKTVWTTALAADEALSTLTARGSDVRLLASRSASGGRAALPLPLAVSGSVDVVADGETTTVDGVQDLDDALDEAGLTLGEEDRIGVALSSAGRVTVTVQRVVTAEEVSVTEVPFETVTEKTSSLTSGVQRTSTAGVVGELTTTYLVVRVDGAEESRVEIDATVTREPVSKVVQVGTAPAPTATASSSSTTVSGDVWAALAQCESGGNPTIVSSNGLYYGLYQFSLPTWQAMGGSGLPSQASAAEQTQRAQALQARSGWGQWPACSSKLGLR